MSINSYAQNFEEFAQQLLKVQQETEKTRREHEQALRTEHVEREASLAAQLREKEKDFQRLEMSWSEQKKALTLELAQLKELQRREHEGLLNMQLQREQEFAVKLLVQQQEAERKLERLHAEQAAREAVYGKRIAETQLQIESMLHTFVQREQEFAQIKERQCQEYDALLHVQVQREQEFAAQLLAQQQRVEKKQESLLTEHARRETNLIEQLLHEQNKEHCRLEQSWTEQQKALRQEFSALQEKLNSEILRRHDEYQAAEHVRRLQTEQYDRDHVVKEAEHRLHHLSPNVRDIYFQLKTARATVHAGRLS